MAARAWVALLGQILAARSLHPSHHKPRNDLTEQAEVLLQKADWRPRGGRSDSRQMCRRPRRSLSGRPAEIGDRDLSSQRTDAVMLVEMKTSTPGRATPRRGLRNGSP